MYKVRLTSEARSQFKRLKQTYKQAIGSVIQDLKEIPYFSKSLQRDLTGRFSYRIGVYRIIYKIDEKEKTVTVLTIGHRSAVYN